MCAPWGATLEMSKEIISVKVEHTLCSQSTYFLSPPPPHYDPDFMFQPRGHHEILKRGRQVYIFLPYLEFYRGGYHFKIWMMIYKKGTVLDSVFLVTMVVRLTRQKTSFNKEKREKSKKVEYSRINLLTLYQWLWILFMAIEDNWTQNSSQ